jgi:hypothetical protein
MTKKNAIALGLILITLKIFPGCRNEPSSKIRHITPYPEYFVEIQPVGSYASETEDFDVFFINDLYRYDSIDIEIIKSILRAKGTKYFIADGNRIFGSANEVDFGHLLEIEYERRKQRKILPR